MSEKQEIKALQANRNIRLDNAKNEIYNNGISKMH